MITSLKQLVTEARAKGRRRLAVAYGQDEHTLAAVADAYANELITAIIYGDREVIEKTCRENNIDHSVFTIVNESDPVKCVAMAVKAVANNEADILMKGLVSTDKYMRGILNKEAGLFPPKGVLSHVAVLELPGYGKLLAFSDAAVIPEPDFKQKTVMLGYLTRISSLLGIENPSVALIAPSEQVLPSVISSTEAAVLAKMGDRGQLGKATFDGPLSLDVALYPEVAKEKKVKGSSVAGHADCLLFPNIESANVFFKSATHMGGAEMAAMVVGTKVPCVLTSRGDTATTKLYSIALACISVSK